MKRLKGALVCAAIGAAYLISPPISAAQPADTGFDEFGYNYKARIFSGPADGVDRILDGKVWGDPTFANDHLVMKWSKGWDDARFGNAPWGPDAWLSNQWSGRNPDGSGWVEIFKCIWVGPLLELSTYWRYGGYALWAEFEAILDHASDPNRQHTFYAHAFPTGYGVN